MDDESAKWVTIARFWSPTQALFFKSVLEGNGIPAFVRNEYLGGLFAHITLSGVDGGIELQTLAPFVDQALTLLEGEQPTEQTEES